MRKYEVTFIAHPDLDTDAFKQLTEQVQGWVKDSGGSVEKTDVWGKKKLAFPVKKQTEGQYVLMHTAMEPVACSQLERQFGLQESVLRFLIVAADETAETAA